MAPYVAFFFVFLASGAAASSECDGLDADLDMSLESHNLLLQVGLNIQKEHPADNIDSRVPSEVGLADAAKKKQVGVVEMASVEVPSSGVEEMHPMVHLLESEFFKNAHKRAIDHVDQGGVFEAGAFQ